MCFDEINDIGVFINKVKNCCGRSSAAVFCRKRNEEMRNKRKQPWFLLFLFSILFLSSGCSNAINQQEKITPTLSLETEQDNIDVENSSLDTELGEINKQVSLEAPSLSERVKRKILPTLEKRLPIAQDIMVETMESVGTYTNLVQFASLYAGEEIGDLIEEGLFRFTADGTIEPNVAKGYEVNDTYTEYTIHLREGMRWSDGELFFADDCVFFYEKMCLKKTFGEEVWDCFICKNPETGKTAYATFEKIDNHTFRVSFAYPKPTFLEELTEQGSWCFAPKHYQVNILTEFMGEQAASAKAKEMGFADIAEMQKETGRYFWKIPGAPTLNAYYLSKEEGKNNLSGDYYEYVRNPYYWKTDTEGKQLPYIDTLAYTRISDTAQRLLLTINGSLTITEVAVEEKEIVEQSAELAGYFICEWNKMRWEDGVLQTEFQVTEGGQERAEVICYAVDNDLKNFPKEAVYCETFGGMRIAKCHTWYLEQ